MLTAACIKTGRPQIARRAIEVAETRLLKDGWPEYYDGTSAVMWASKPESFRHGLLQVIWWPR